MNAYQPPAHQAMPLQEAHEDSPAEDQIEEEQEDLCLQIYKNYSQQSDGTSSMDIHTYFTMLKDAGLIQSYDHQNNSIHALSNADVELIYAKSINHRDPSSLSQGNSLSFAQFMYSLELVSHKCLRDSENPMLELLQEYILHLVEEEEESDREEVKEQEQIQVHEHEETHQPDPEDGNETIENLMKILKNEEMIDLLEIVHQTLIPFYSNYSDT